MAASHHARGLYEADPELLQTAGATHRTIGAQVAAWEDAGVILLDAGDKSAARAQLERAVASYEQLGAESDAARVRSRLGAIGVRWRHGRRAERLVSGWESLTDTERAVAEHVAEGLTNAQVAERMFLSRHTVDFNLRRIFRKLGIRSRVALARVCLESHPRGCRETRIRVMRGAVARAHGGGRAVLPPVDDPVRRALRTGL